MYWFYELLPPPKIQNKLCGVWIPFMLVEALKGPKKIGRNVTTMRIFQCLYPRLSLHSHWTYCNQPPSWNHQISFLWPSRFKLQCCEDCYAVELTQLIKNAQDSEVSVSVSQVILHQFFFCDVRLHGPASAAGEEVVVQIWLRQTIVSSKPDSLFLFRLWLNVY